MMDRRRLLAWIAQWEPYRVIILGEMTLLAPFILFTFHRFTGETLRSFPAPAGHIFLVGIALCSGVALYGVIRRYTAHGMLWERAGQIGIAILLVTYGIWAASLFGAPGLQFAGMIFSRALAAILRAIQLEVIRRRESNLWPFRTG